MEGPSSIKPTHAYHFNPFASHLDSSKVRMSLSQTGPFALHMVEQLLSAKNSTQTEVPHPSTRYTFPIGLLTNGMELPNITPAWNCQTFHQPKNKNDFIVCALQLNTSCLTDFE